MCEGLCKVVYTTFHGVSLVVYTTYVNWGKLAFMSLASTGRPSPIFEQVKAFVRGHISSGNWKPGDPVPSEAALGGQFGVARMTVNRAMRDLVADGLVTRVRGSGTRVAQLHRISSRLSIRDIHDEVLERGHVHSVRVLLVATESACIELAESLEIKPGSAVFHSQIVHLENGIPIQHEDRFVNPAAAPDYLSIDFSRTTPTRHLLLHAPLTEASYTIEACLPDAHVARELGIKKGAACLAMTRRTVSGAHVASVARLTYPGTRYSFAGQFQA